MSNILNYDNLSDCNIIKYTYTSACNGNERIIKLVKSALDPLEPPKFKRTKCPKVSARSSHVPVMHSPPRPVTLKEQQEWRIPPCISNWKNPKGYTIPLEKRLACQENAVINGNFPKLSEALCVAEQKAREAVEMRLKVRKEIITKGKEKDEQKLRKLAAEARSQLSDFCCQGRRTQEERKRGRKRGKSSEFARVEAGRGEVMYDQLLFNQDKGLNSGLFGNDEEYNVYDKRLFRHSTQKPPVKFQQSEDDDDVFGLEQWIAVMNKGK